MSCLVHKVASFPRQSAQYEPGRDRQGPLDICLFASVVIKEAIEKMILINQITVASAVYYT